MRQILSDIWPVPAQKTDSFVTVVISLAGYMPEMPWRKADYEGFIELNKKLDEKARNDLEENNIFWDRFEGKTAEVSTKG